MIQLGIIPTGFPQIGGASPGNPPAGIFSVEPHAAPAATGSPTPSDEDSCPPPNLACDDTRARATCGCLLRACPPDMPAKLPFAAKPENTAKMRQWITERYASSAFNKCKHQTLPEMEGPPLSLHVKEGAVPYKCTKPAPVPLHWEKEVREDLMADVKMGVMERVPHGERCSFCTRMVITRKHDGRPRRTVDLSHLNKFCDREEHPMKSPFHLARSIPSFSVKTVFDAWNGYHSVPIRDQDRHYTSFCTQWGLFRYKRAPQGSALSGDAYNRRFDEILVDFERAPRIVDDCCLHDPSESLEEHWWRVLKFIETTAKAGIILNEDKFQFSQSTVDFAGFRVGDQVVEPLPKYLDAIRNYPTPTCTTDIRSWFGLINQVSHYSQLTELMEPFRRFLSPKEPFEWTVDLESTFQASKERIVEAIQQGVRIFNPSLPTAVIPDWSKTGVGFWVVQKHCSCEHIGPPDCCTSGWKIVLAGSRFLSSAERNYAPVEGEALAVAWALEQARFFTLGCSKLYVVTDHKPLLKLLGNRRLDEIPNPRLFRLKQRTLLWDFHILHRPGKQNQFADAMSRRPNQYAELASLQLMSEGDVVEGMIAAAISQEMEGFFAVSWDRILAATSSDPDLPALRSHILDGFPDAKRDLQPALQQFWEFRDALSVLNGVITYNDRVVVPPALRPQVLSNLHCAHQGVTNMQARALQSVFWPGITADLEGTRESCRTCHRNAPSQPKLPPTASDPPRIPFEQIACDYFDLSGKHYLITVDRLSGWVEVIHVKPSTSSAGAKGLCSALRRLFATFGVPTELSSDGGPEFTAPFTLDFYERWGTRHRLSSAYLPHSNGRAEQAVKVMKRLIEENVGPNGDLDNDRLVAALLQHRNTPDRDCGLSPAQILFGRNLRDSLPGIDKSKTIFANTDIRACWRENWEAKEQAIRSRMALNCERLEAGSRDLQPLQQGDSVFIQNQGSLKKPLKWDREGTIVSQGKNDQYLVKVAGSGRLTLRNRRFLRKFSPANSPVATSPTPTRALSPDPVATGTAPVFPLPPPGNHSSLSDPQEEPLPPHAPPVHQSAQSPLLPSVLPPLPRSPSQEPLQPTPPSNTLQSDTGPPPNHAWSPPAAAPPRERKPPLPARAPSTRERRQPQRFNFSGDYA